jgi:hypothetical protein
VRLSKSLVGQGEALSFAKTHRRCIDPQRGRFPLFSCEALVRALSALRSTAHLLIADTELIKSIEYSRGRTSRTEDPSMRSLLTKKREQRVVEAPDIRIMCGDMELA